MTDDKPNKQPPALGPNALRHAQYERAHLFCIVPNETTFEQVMTPSFWRHHVALLSGGPTARPFARIEVMRADGTMDLDLRVMSTGPGMAVMRVLRKFVSDENLGKPPKGVNAGDEKLDFPDGYKGSHAPNARPPGWQVRLNPSGEVLASGLPSKAAAVAKAWDHLKAANTPVLETT